MSRIIELKWDCAECSSTGILGRNKRCPNCGSPREKGEMKMGGLASTKGGYNPAASVTNRDLLNLATAGPDWFCSHCGAGNKGDGDKCDGIGGDGCGAPRYGNADEDHPDFKGEHRKVTIGDDPWEDGWDPELAGLAEGSQPVTTPGPQPTDSSDQAGSASLEDDYEPDPADDWAAQKRRDSNLKVATVVVASVLALTLLTGFLWWAFTTHEVEGIVTDMSWEQNTIVQTWTETVTREWEDDTRYMSEREPRNGTGERAGMDKIAGSCSEDHHHDESYVCGSHQECTPRTRSESYDCGETCTDNGNGFATCTTNTCYRDVPDGETCSTVDDYCDRAIYETKCSYRTQVWKTTKTHPATGKGRNTRWPEANPGRLDRLRYAADYSVVITYDDGKGDETYDLKPGSTKFLGMQKTLTQSQARTAEKAYREWSIAHKVTLKINNLGGVRSVTHGGLELVASAEEE